MVFFHMGHFSEKFLCPKQWNPRYLNRYYLISASPRIQYRLTNTSLNTSQTVMWNKYIEENFNLILHDQNHHWCSMLMIILTKAPGTDLEKAGKISRQYSIDGIPDYLHINVIWHSLQQASDTSQYALLVYRSSQSHSLTGYWALNVSCWHFQTFIVNCERVASCSLHEIISTINV